ncbi:hypothetical protein E2C01_074359 [Portunus trituberculatus]|uniref:Uncharacterized protein n=1 Tax=Portunus trituberculatus TaxID=210409 RepID=A0A5B7IBY7_PORTR|nr:hypothetical protein [Portunus trituberculatus]
MLSSLLCVAAQDIQESAAYSRCGLISSGPMAFCVSSPHNNHLVMRHFNHGDSLLAPLDQLRRWLLWIPHLHFSSKQGSQQLCPLLTAGGDSTVLLAEGRDGFLVASSLFVLNKGPRSFVSYVGATQFPAQVFLPLF